MSQSLLLTIVILLMLLAERLASFYFTRQPWSRAFIQRCILLHPNTISLIRIPMGLVSVLLISQGLWTCGILWFAFWMITDLTDGTIARNCDLSTETGKWLDPLSDKCMYFPCLLYLSLGQGIHPEVRLNLWGVLAFIGIDTLGQFSRLFSKKKAANSFGKAKTALVTILLSTAALYHLEPLTLINSNVVSYMLFSCVLLAFLSVYCKVVPDFWYANTLTFANFLCGLAATWVVCRHNYFTLGFVLIFIGQFFDLFDGRLARKFGSTKRGAFFDDVADATSFGLAVGCMIFRGLSYGNSIIPPWLAVLCAIFYTTCLVYRLYRFLHPTRQYPKGIFQGLPSPAGALLACSGVLVGLMHSHPLSSIFAALLVLLSSCLMVSNIPYRHFGQSLWPAFPVAVKLLLLVVLTVFVNIMLVKRRDWEFAFVWFCMLISVLYAFFAIASRKQLAE